MYPRFLLTTLALVGLISLTASSNEDAVPAILGSTVWDWNDFLVKPTKVGARRDVHDGPTATLERFECHISTLNPGMVSHPPHQHAQEEFIILQDGTLDVGIDGTVQRVGPGSMFFFASNDWHNVHNTGGKPATYLVFNVATAATRTAPAVEAAKSAAPGTLPSEVFAWTKMDVKKTTTGERREVFDGPSVTCTNLECHVTTLDPEVSPHASHHHPDEELIIVKDGTIEATINGVAGTVGRGSILFFASNDEHGLRNAGNTTATYYVVRVVTDQTPGS